MKVISKFIFSSMLMLGFNTFAHGDDHKDRKHEDARHEDHDDDKTTDLKQGEILGYLEAVNKHEIEAAETAEKKEIHASVMSFAKMLKKDHEKNLKDVIQLSKKINVEIEQSAGIVAFRTKAAAERALLLPLTGDKYASSYIDAMVKGHQEVLDLIDQKLLPSVQNKHIKKHLTDTRASVVRHRDEAKKLQATFAKS